MTKTPKWIVTATTPRGAVVYRDTIDAWSEGTAIETGKGRKDGEAVQRVWPDAKWSAVALSKGSQPAAEKSYTTPQ